MMVPLDVPLASGDELHCAQKSLGNRTLLMPGLHERSTVHGDVFKGGNSGRKKEEKL